MSHKYFLTTNETNDDGQLMCVIEYYEGGERLDTHFMKSEEFAAQRGQRFLRGEDPVTMGIIG